MNIPISRVIRKLRRERSITQEELAAVLGITYQSVSRWENGQAYPDIELIPKIAQYFNISTDVLFGTDKESIDIRREEHYKKIREVQNDKEAFYQACLSAYEDFPDEFSFGLWLCRCYIDYKVRPLEKYLSEIRNICRNIIENCSDEDYRIEAFHKIIITENDESLESWLALLPSWKISRNIMLEERFEYRGETEKCNLQKQENFLTYLGYAFYNCVSECDDQIKSIERYQLILNLIDTMRDTSTDIDAWIEMRADFLLRISAAHFSAKQNEKGYESLKKAIDLYVKYAELPIDIELSYNCTILDLLSENKKSAPEDDTENKGEYVCWWAYHHLTDSDGWQCFDYVRNEERFKSLTDRLIKFLPKAKN